MSAIPKPIVLIVLDGWGYRTETVHNAIAAAHKPNWDKLWQQYPHTTISGSGRCVGLPDGQMGNSEVGHMNIGLGRVVFQDYTRINEAIDSGEFFHNAVLMQAIQTAIAQQQAVHIMGLLSPGGVHSHEQQLFALIHLAAQQGAKRVYIHAFLDGRDTPPQSAAASLERLQAVIDKTNCGEIASICGRYYAMDRDKRWDRVQAAYDMLTLGLAPYSAQTALEGLAAAYARGETDEFVQPTLIATQTMPAIIKDGDVVINMNFRADRARELSYALTQADFHGFTRQVWPHVSAYVTLTEYATDIAAQVAYPPQSLRNGLGEILSQAHLTQLRIAETEKYAHVTFFFNGGNETTYPGEQRILVPSPKVATYDLQPEMSAYQLTEQLVAAINSQHYDFIVCNFANPDMVGHTGNFAAAVKAIEAVDTCLGKIIHAVQTVGGEVLITADHGNAECMYDDHTKQPHTAHTTEPVPLLYIGRPAHFIIEDGKLADLAPTILSLMHLPIPAEMTGRQLLVAEE
jgi:2,3-bisphosphoglycerate-independent phosphoglycerate mutase